MTAQPKADYETLSDLELAACLAGRDVAAVRLVTTRNNQRLFRTAWSILRNRAEAEDAVQSGYLKAFAAIEGFKGASSLSTWLTRIVINEALGRRRSERRRHAGLDDTSVVVMEEYREKLMSGSNAPAAPDATLAREQLRRLLEAAIARLAPTFRLVFVLREVEGLSVEETAETLGIPTATVKTRHLRARRRLQQDLDPELRSALTGTFPFAGADCEAMTERVVACLGELSPQPARTSTDD
jgi:RNA polymerase sigma-70 factor (ECF subfamily)